MARAFWARRCRRLMPALALLLAAWTLLAISGGTVGQALSRGYTDAAPWQAVAAGAVIPWTGLANQWLVDGMPFPVSLGHLWSLPVEWQFYAATPLVIIAAARTRSRAAAAGILAAAAAACWAMAAWQAQDGDVVTAYAGTAGRLPALLAGAAAGIAASSSLPGVPWQPGPKARAVILAAGGLIVVFAALTADKSSSSWLSWVGGFGFSAAAITWAVGSMPGQAGGRLLAWAGRRSYAAYLWNWPVVCVAVAVSGMPGSWWQAAALAAACWAATWLMATASWHLVEQRWPSPSRANPTG